MTESRRNISVDRIGLQLNAYTWYRPGLMLPVVDPIPSRSFDQITIATKV
jgi:hypothetical protein